LEVDLVTAQEQNRLLGILNGCEYPAGTSYARYPKSKMIELFKESLMLWMSRSRTMASAHWIAMERIKNWELRREKGTIITSVGRITEQKVRLYETQVVVKNQKKMAIEHMLDALGDRGLFILLGSGDSYYESLLLNVAGRYSNFIFLNGYSEEVSKALYNSGDLFMMPSSYEPCGISQMLSMRAGQPCLVHGVGGLNDTVKDDSNGFVFRGGSGEKQAEHMYKRFTDVLKMIREDRKTFKSIATKAKAARFLWEESAKDYIEKLYK